MTMVTQCIYQNAQVFFRRSETKKKQTKKTGSSGEFLHNAEFKLKDEHWTKGTSNAHPSSLARRSFFNFHYLTKKNEPKLEVTVAVRVYTVLTERREAVSQLFRQ